jgi:hypothetical protein
MEVAMQNQPYYPPGQAPGQYPYPYPPQPKSSSNCLIFVLLGGGAAFMALCFCAAAAIFFAEPILTAFDDIFAPVVGGGDTAVLVRSGESNLIASPEGVSIAVPVAAVPFMDSGEAGAMVFSIEARDAPLPTLTEGLEIVGAIYDFGPSGFNFNAPVIISLPIPDGVDVDSVIGLSSYDPQDGEWKLVPSFINAAERTVSASVIHFTPFGVTRGVQGFYDNLAHWQRENGGNIQVHLLHNHGNSFNHNDGLTGTSYSGRTFTYGVCIESYVLADNDPATRIWPHWETPTGYLYTVEDRYHGSTRFPGPRAWWLPSGTYQLSEIVGVSEVNPGNPLYSPKFKSYWRPVGNLVVTPGSQANFNFADIASEFHTWQEGRPTCYGAATTSVGTGDIQITLTWQTNDDIDLHVIDPSGFEIYYADPIAPSGGSLDRDNLCMNMEIGRPENVYWPMDVAPSGEYIVKVHYYGACERERTVDWTVRIVRSGEVETFTGSLTQAGETQTVTSFRIR